MKLRAIGAILLGLGIVAAIQAGIASGVGAGSGTAEGDIQGTDDDANETLTLDTTPNRRITVTCVSVVNPAGDFEKLVEGQHYKLNADGTAKPEIEFEGDERFLAPDGSFVLRVTATTNGNSS